MSLLPLLKTKFHIPPRRNEIVPRPRLIQLLERGWDPGKKLILISAPAGYGKTTLLVEWIHQQKAPVAWLSLDKRDNDPNRFWQQVITALQTMRPEIGEGFLAAQNSPRTSPFELLLTGLINEITADPAPLALVLDDFHEIHTPQIHAGIGFLLDHLPVYFRLVLSGRADPPWPLGRRRALSDLIELRAKDLRFNANEVVEFVNRAMGLGLSEQEAAALDTRTEGWIAGLQMAALSMQHHADKQFFIESFRGSNRFILDYLLEEVLSRQPAQVQDFLLKTSILMSITASLCKAVVEENVDPDGNPPENHDDTAYQSLLEELDRNNLFVSQMDEERLWYRYHPLFSDLLRNRLVREQADLVPDLHHKASQWYARNGLIDEALSHALDAQMYERAARLVEQHGMQMIVTGRLSTLVRWLELLPAELIKEKPWLCVYYGWVRYYIGPRDKVEACLRQAESSLHSLSGVLFGKDTQAEVRRITGHIAALRAYIALQNQDLHRVAEYAQNALDLLPDGDYARGTSAIALAETHRTSGDLSASERAYIHARKIAEACDNIPMAVSSVAYMGLQQAKQGFLYKARETYQGALRLATDSRGRLSPSAGLPYVKLGDLYREWNQLDTASDYLEKGVQLSQLWGHADALVTAYTLLARIQLARTHYKQAWQTLRQATELVERTEVDPWAIPWIDDCRIRLWLATGELTNAIHWVGTSGLTVEDEFSYVRDLEHVNLARVLLAQSMKQPDEQLLNQVNYFLSRLLMAAQSAGWVGRTIEILLLQSLTYNLNGDHQASQASLAKAVMMGESQGYLRLFLDEGLPMYTLLIQCAGQDTFPPAYMKQLLAAFEAEIQLPTKPRVRSLSLEGPSTILIEPLSAREMEVLKLLNTSLSANDIGVELCIATSTVHTHIRSIYAKLDVHSRIEAIQLAKDLGLL